MTLGQESMLHMALGPPCGSQDVAVNPDSPEADC